MKKIIIGYFADGPWSHKTFKRLIQDKSIEIAFIVPRTDTKDSTLKSFSEKYNIDYLANSRINTKEFIDSIRKYNCDLLVSMSFNQIFKTEIINLAPEKIINCHAGKLPFYRGRNVLNWVLINDEKEFGITVHYIDEGIDTGDIIIQRTFPITDDDNYNTILEQAYIECANILYDAVKQIQKGEIKLTVQKDIHPVGFYCGAREVGDEKLNWNQTSREIFNFVRAICKPGPQAITNSDNNTIMINKVKLIPDAPEYSGTIGQVVGMNNGNPIVKTKDTTIEIIEYTSDLKLKIGSRMN